MVIGNSNSIMTQIRHEQQGSNCFKVPNVVQYCREGNNSLVYCFVAIRSCHLIRLALIWHFKAQQVWN